MAFPAAVICSPTTSPLVSIASISNSNSPLPFQTTFISCENCSKAPFTSHTSQRSRSSHFRMSYRFSGAEDDDDEAEECSFDEAVALFNTRAYYKCHDFLESIWSKAEEPTRTLVHGILQCAVGFHHLFSQNHKGAMMELGEGVCKLRKMNFKRGPFYEFEIEISAALEFIYKTQIELAACGDDVCVAMDRSERSYQLLGRYAEGELIYSLQQQVDGDGHEMVYIVFTPQRSYGGEAPKVKLPTLNATTQHLISHGL